MWDTPQVRIWPAWKGPFTHKKAHRSPIYPFSDPSPLPLLSDPLPCLFCPTPLRQALLHYDRVIIINERSTGRDDPDIYFRKVRSYLDRD